MTVSSSEPVSVPTSVKYGYIDWSLAILEAEFSSKDRVDPSLPEDFPGPEDYARWAAFSKRSAASVGDMMRALASER